ncbi:tryptophan synthase beta chain 2-like [Ylistrum balloti]|uniref:tryptophan synthase beta chain 2-like n=1 Tax=Ylistrum balloti TaxID=509963 RepID=UPI002905ED99|nr:tryptophan synthase beta chain 2-like [Ylistrum balloti]
MQTKIILEEKDLPKHWYNISPDLPEPMSPPLHPGTKKPIGPDDLAPLFPMSLIAQEVSMEREIEIPEPVRAVYKQWRPSPLFRAYNLEKFLDTPAKIYYKYEGLSPSGSHKPNTSIAQAFYNKEAGIKRISTETGAGQWGSALSYAGAIFGLDIEVYMVKISYHQKPYRKSLMESYGAKCIPSPSETTNAGRAILEKDRNSNGSLGIAISEAVEVAAQNSNTNYALGSVLNHVLLHQTVIGLEAIKQMEIADVYPDIIIGCTGGGSNFAGIVLPFLGKAIKENKNTRFIAVEPSACPSLTKGKFAYDYGDTMHLTPLVKMYTLGADFMPPGFHSGGLRYHGMSPLISHLKNHSYIEAESFFQNDCLKSGITFAKTEGIIPAPEASHAVHGAIAKALECKRDGTAKTILFNLCGHGYFDMKAYEDFLAGTLDDSLFDETSITESLTKLPVL